MATQRRVQLCFGGTAAEVGTAGDLDELKKQIESQLALQPDSYGLFDTCGEVATPAALLRSLCAAGEDICRLEVRERPVWKRMREVEAQLQAQLQAVSFGGSNAGGAGAGAAALNALEQRILGKVERMISDVEGRTRRTEAGLGQGGPLLESVAVEQISTRKKVEGLDASIGPLLQSLALEQMDCKATLSESVTALRAMETMGDGLTKKIDDLAQAELKLQEELASLQQSARSIQGLEKKFSQLQAKALGSSPKASPKGSRGLLQEAAKETAQSATVNFKDTEVQWPDGMVMSPPAAMFAYSAKALPLGGGPGVAFRAPGAVAPFARGDPGARLRERRMLPSTSLSLPSLPPLQA